LSPFNTTGSSIHPPANRRCDVRRIDPGSRGANIETDDWRATLRALGGCAFPMVQKRVRENVAAVRGVLHSLSQGLRATFRVVERDELDALGSGSRQRR
jgi:hypothetical protein